MKTTLNIEGLDCAACAAELEEELGKIDGIISASVSFVMQKIALEYENEAALKKAVDTANHFEEVRVLSDGSEKEEAAETDEKKESGGKVVLKLEGLHCAACAAELEAQIAKIRGIRQVSVDVIYEHTFFRIQIVFIKQALIDTGIRLYHPNHS